MYNYSTNHSGNLNYSEYAEWLTVSEILDIWCVSDRSNRDTKQRAILGACERGEIEYTRSDGKSFDDPVIDLQGRGILLINKHSCNQWKKTIEKVKTKEVNTNNLNTTYDSFDDFLKSIDDEYISIKDLVNAIHKHIGLYQPIEKAYQVLTSAIGRSEEKPHIFKKDKFLGWQKGVLDYQSISSFKPKSFVLHSEQLHTIESAIEIEKVERDNNELPF